MISTKKQGKALVLMLSLLVSFQLFAQAKLPDLIEKAALSVVGIGIFTPIESRVPSLIGTGFVVGDGNYIVTNYHVVSKELDPSIVQSYVAMVGEGRQYRSIKLDLIAFDPVHDLAILALKSAMPGTSAGSSTGGAELSGLRLGSDDYLRAGSDVFFTGFPLGAVLGLYHATHTGIIAAVAPDINPARNANQLTIDMLARLKQPFMIYQLDATAYPGNSGSPVFDRETGEVVAVINKVFVQAGKEAAISAPSGISYAIPIRHLRKLAKNNKIAL
ncbi:serine protease [Glaciecola siphonariae]|uniref:Serine protease n=1 Tax=Glaciecola siphonariae TaxID=521012 RepID=A0ABV9LUD6_9ALTE